MTAERRAALLTLLQQLRAVLQAQAEAINTDDFDGLERLAAERDALVPQLSAYAASDLDADGRALTEQVSALDQQLVPLTRESLARTGQELRELARGRSALQEYRRRGQTLIQNLAHYSPQD